MSPTPKPTLLDIGEAYLKLEEVLLETGGELTPEVEAAFEALGGLEAAKVDGYASLVKSLDAYARACALQRRTLVEELGAKEKAAQGAVERLKERMKLYLEGRGVSEVRGSVWRAALQRNSTRPALELLVPPEDLPQEFVVVTVSADLEKLKATVADHDPDEPVELTVKGQVVARWPGRGTHVRFR